MVYVKTGGCLVPIGNPNNGCGCVPVIGMIAVISFFMFSRKVHVERSIHRWHRSR